jgi:hypothetical protein
MSFAGCFQRQWGSRWRAGTAHPQRRRARCRRRDAAGRTSRACRQRRTVLWHSRRRCCCCCSCGRCRPPPGRPRYAPLLDRTGSGCRGGQVLPAARHTHPSHSQAHDRGHDSQHRASALTLQRPRPTARLRTSLHTSPKASASLTLHASKSCATCPRQLPRPTRRAWSACCWLPGPSGAGRPRISARCSGRFAAKPGGAAGGAAAPPSSPAAASAAASPSTGMGTGPAAPSPGAGLPTTHNGQIWGSGHETKRNAVPNRSPAARARDSRRVGHVAQQL